MPAPYTLNPDHTHRGALRERVWPELHLPSTDREERYALPLTLNQPNINLESCAFEVVPVQAWLTRIGLSPGSTTTASEWLTRISLSMGSTATASILAQLATWTTQCRNHGSVQNQTKSLEEQNEHDSRVADMALCMSSRHYNDD